MTSTHRHRLLAFAGSFLVYGIPLVGPHAAWLLGEALFQAASSDRTVAWIAADVGFALVLQALTFTILLWALPRPLRLGVFIIVVPAMWMAAETMYLAVIPGYFLIEADTVPETNAPDERCAIEKVSLLPVRVPLDLPKLPVEEWWLQYPDGRYGMLRARDCSVTMATFPQPTVQNGRADFTLGFQFFVPGRGAIVERLEPPTGRRTWWLVRRADAPMEPLTAPDHQETPPILSSDGQAVVWQQTIPGSPPPVLTQLIVHSVSANDPDVTIDLTSLGPASYVVAAAHVQSHAVTLWRNEQIIVVGFDGRLRGVLRGSDPGQITPARPLANALVRPQPGTYLIGPDGAWLAWDAYKEEGAYRLEWMTDHGGSFTLPKGRSVTDAAFDPSRKLIAISASTTLSIGDTQDLLAIVRADDGRDVFRRYLSRYSRSPTVFFSNGLFGYSDLTGVHVVSVGP